MLYVRTKENQAKHDSGVAAWANSVINAGWSYVLSDLPGNNKPPTIDGYIPDIYATHGNREYVIEVETVDSVNSSHALLQKAIFQRWADTISGRVFQVQVV